MFNYFWSSKAPKNEESDDPKTALLQQLDEHSDFKVLESGILDFDDFCHFRGICLRQSQRAYDKVKQENDDLRMQAFKTKDWVNYSQIWKKQN